MSRAMPAGMLRGQRGVAALEFAVLAPVLILALLLLADFGFAAMTKLRLVNASAAAARYAAQFQGDPEQLGRDRLQAIARSDSGLDTLDLELVAHGSGDQRYCASGPPPSFTPANSGQACGDGTPPGRFLTITTRVSKAPLLDSLSVFGKLLSLSETAVVRLP